MVPVLKTNPTGFSVSYLKARAVPPTVKTIPFAQKQRDYHGMSQRPKPKPNRTWKIRRIFLTSQGAQNMIIPSVWQPSFQFALPSYDSMGDPHMPQGDALFNILIRGSWLSSLLPTKHHTELLWDCYWQAEINLCLSSHSLGRGRIKSAHAGHTSLHHNF